MRKPPPEAVREMLVRADELSLRGQWADAVSIWNGIIEAFPRNAVALNHLGAHSMARGDLAASLDYLLRAVASEPKFTMAHANLSRLASLRGDQAQALERINDAIASDPTAWGPHFEKARLLEAAGRRREAAMSWGNGLSYMAEPIRNSPHAREWVRQAQDAVRENQAELRVALETRVDDLRKGMRHGELERFNHCLDIVTGRRQFVTARPLTLPFPRLPAIQFFERGEFPWAAAVEAEFPAMLAELQALLDARREFVPYVQTTPGAPAGQFAGLDHNLDWGAYFLWKDGRRIDEHADLCPRTEAALAAAPQHRVPTRAPVVFFSALKPGTHIPPHNGATNTRLTVHMPLLVPPDCGLRVGDETRQWRPGELVIFDDTIRHEAWNFSNQLRVVMIFDIWHPMLSQAERLLVSEMVQGIVEFFGADAVGEL